MFSPRQFSSVKPNNGVEFHQLFSLSLTGVMILTSDVTKQANRQSKKQADKLIDYMTYGGAKLSGDENFHILRTS